MPLQIGQILNSRYRIVKLLGQGGFGAVYRAWDINMDRPLALKENLDTSPDAQLQFKNEAQILFDLTHPNLPKVIDHFIIKGQGQYLVMEYVDGEDLQQMLDKKGGPLPESQVIPWIEQVCEAVHYLHNLEPAVIHRDIKPANIKITPEGNAMLVDFGIAKIFDPDLRTRFGARAVTPGYSPPEQYGQGNTDARTDIYAIGATLFSLLTGKVPAESINRVIKDSFIPPERINPAISSAIARAIRKAMILDPDQRPSNVKSFIQIIKGPDRRIIKKWAPWIVLSFLTVLFLVILWPSGGTEIEALTTTHVPTSNLIEDTPEPERSEIEEPPTILLPSLTASLRQSPSPSPITPSLTLNIAIPPACTEAGQTWTSPKDGMLLSCIPEGEFLIGSDTGGEDERPVHWVFLDAFWMDQTEVTFAQFNQFMVEENYEATPCAGGDNYPVGCVNWNDARAYCEWAERRLPTEAEWEKAARGRLEGMKYPWGNESPICSQGAQNGAQFQSCGGQAVPVKTFSPNDYGLFDMAGNLWEWIKECYQMDFYNTYPPDGWPNNPQGSTTCTSPGIRGGGWNSPLADLRVSNRGGAPFSVGTDFRGFRCVVDTGL